MIDIPWLEKLEATEPLITINGVELTLGQRVTVRIALEVFRNVLAAGRDEGQLGPAEVNYMDRLNEIINLPLVRVKLERKG